MITQPVWIMLAIGAAGGVGALARFGLQRAFPARDGRIPRGVLIANVVGSFIAGVAGGSMMATDPALGLIIVTGFCGGLTTFSTFAVETVELGRAGARRGMVLNALATLALGLAAASAGLLLATVFA